MTETASILRFDIRKLRDPAQFRLAPAGGGEKRGLPEAAPAQLNPDGQILIPRLPGGKWPETRFA